MEFMSDFSTLNYQLDVSKKIIKYNHSEHYKNLYNLLGFQHYLKTLIPKFNDLDEFDSLKNSYIYLLFSTNLHCILSALHSLEFIMMHPVASNLRTVCESIPKMYYISLYPNKIAEILNCEIIHTVPKYDIANKILNKHYSKNSVDSRLLSFSTQSEFTTFKKQYTPHGFRNALYDECRRSIIEQSYNHLSDSVHSNLSCDTLSGYSDSTRINLFFNYLQKLSYYNIRAFLEGNFNIINSELNSEHFNFLNDLYLSFKFTLPNLNFEPNKIDIPKLNIK